MIKDDYPWFSSELNLRLLKENIELFFKKESNFKRPLKIEMIFAKLTKSFIPHYEWNGHRRRIPWKLLKKDQTVNKFPSAFFTTKTGLHQSLQQLHWYSPFPVASFFPRCYQVRLSKPFNFAICISIWLWFNLSTHRVSGGIFLPKNTTITLVYHRF